MKLKSLKLPTVFTMIAMFTLAIIMCCCTQQPASAAVVKIQKSVPACHQQHQAPNTKPQDCSCCTVKKLTADSTPASPVITDQISGAFLLDAPRAVSLSLVKQYDINLRDGPPGSLQVPLYILHHSIRC